MNDERRFTHSDQTFDLQASLGTELSMKGRERSEKYWLKSAICHLSLTTMKKKNKKRTLATVV